MEAQQSRITCNFFDIYKTQLSITKDIKKNKNNYFFNKKHQHSKREEMHIDIAD
jgi:hypothetical protein